MKTTMLKRAYLFLIILCMIFNLCACGGNEKSAVSGVTSEKITIEDNSTEQLKFYVDGLFNYNIIFPTDYTDTQYQMVKETVFAKARKINNKRPNTFKESIAKENGLKNIYVGNIDSKVSKEAIDYVKSDGGYFEEYIILAKKGDIAIYALNDQTLRIALEYFSENILKDENSTMGNDYLYHFGGEDNDNIAINGVPVSNYVINCNDYPQGMVYRGCKELQTAIKEASGYEVPILCGYDDTYKYRIVVTEDGEDLNAYKIEVTEDGVMNVTGGHGYSLNAALHKLAKNISVSDDVKLDIKQGEILSGSYDSNTLNTDGYKLVFSDEFNNNTLDKGWKIGEWEDIESQYLVDKESISLKDGSALLEGHPTTLSNGSMGYSGVELIRDDMSFSYGYFEIRAKLPRGGGSQTAFWMKGSRTADFNKPYTCEIDVFETFGQDKELISGIHSWWQPDATIKGLKCTDAQQLEGHIQHITQHSSEMDGGRRHTIVNKNGETSPADAWHTYGCEWTPKYIKYFCDGYEYFHLDIDAAMIDPVTNEKVSEFMLFTSGVEVNFYLWNMVVPNSKLTKPMNEFSEEISKFYVDYVHLYQIPDVGIYTKITKE